MRLGLKSNGQPRYPFRRACYDGMADGFLCQPHRCALLLLPPAARCCSSRCPLRFLLLFLLLFASLVLASRAR